MTTSHGEPRPNQDKRPFRFGLLTGFAVVAIPMLLAAMVGGRDGAMIIGGLIAFPLLTLIGGILAIFLPPRKFALGLLLADAFALLVLVPVCGGVIGPGLKI